MDSSSGANESLGARNDTSVDEAGPNQSEPVLSFFRVIHCLGEDNEAYVHISSDDPFVSDQRIDRRMSLSEFRRAIGSSDQQFDDATADLQSSLRENTKHVQDPTDIRDRETRFEARIMPAKPKCYRAVPHLTSIKSFMQGNDKFRIDRTFELDHPDGFFVYQVAGLEGWSLLQALATALTIRYPGTETSVLDLYYFYKKALLREPYNQVLKGKLKALSSHDKYTCVSNWSLTAQALDYYMEYLGQKPHTFVVVQPPDDKTTPLGRVFTIPIGLTDMMVAKMERLWLMYTEPNDGQEAHFNAVMPREILPIRMHKRLIRALDDLDRTQLSDYVNDIRRLEKDLSNKKISMVSLTLGQTQQLFRETADERNEHMNQPGFGSIAVDAHGNDQEQSRLSQMCDNMMAQQMPFAPAPECPGDKAPDLKEPAPKIPLSPRVKPEPSSPKPLRSTGEKHGAKELLQKPSHVEVKAGSSKDKLISISSDTSSEYANDYKAQYKSKIPVIDLTHDHDNSDATSSANSVSSLTPLQPQADEAGTGRSAPAHTPTNTVSVTPSQPPKGSIDTWLDVSQGHFQRRPNNDFKTTNSRVSPMESRKDEKVAPDASNGHQKNDDSESEDDNNIVKATKNSRIQKGKQPIAVKKNKEGTGAKAVAAASADADINKNEPSSKKKTPRNSNGQNCSITSYRPALKAPKLAAKNLQKIYDKNIKDKNIKGKNIKGKNIEDKNIEDKNIKDKKDKDKNIKDKKDKDKKDGHSSSKRAGPDDITPPDPKKAKSHRDDKDNTTVSAQDDSGSNAPLDADYDLFAGLVRPRPSAPAEVLAARRHEEQVASRRLKVFGLGGFKWQPKNAKKK